MKCENCPLKNKTCKCNGENAPIICNKPEYQQLLQDCAPEPPKEYPSVVIQTNNFVNDMFNFFTSGMNLAEENVYGTRLDICRACPSYDNIQGRCKECGCFMNIKAHITAATCPLNKWP